MGIAKALLIFFVIFEALNFSGFSYSKFRWLSDAEFLRIAADHAARRKSREINYRDGSDLLRSNPSCCVVKRHGHWFVNYSTRLLGWYVVVVELNYKAATSPKYPNYCQDIFLSAGGQILRDMGMECSANGLR